MPGNTNGAPVAANHVSSGRLLGDSLVNQGLCQSITRAVPTPHQTKLQAPTFFRPVSQPPPPQLNTADGRASCIFQSSASTYSLT